MALCPSNCQVVLTKLPPAPCIIEPRYSTLDRMGFFDCATTLPDPLTPELIEDLIADGTIVISSIFSSSWSAPTVEQISLGNCYPQREVVTGRELIIEDRVPVSYTSGSPAVTDDYYDYDFWQSIVEQQASLNYMMIMCSGDVILPKDKNGNLLKASVSGYIDYQLPATPGGNNWIEFKRITIRFANDPLAFFTAKPVTNIAEISY